MKKIAIILVLTAGAAATAWRIYARVREPFQGYAGHEQFIEIPQGAGSRAIGDRLVAGGVVRDRLTFRVALWITRQGRRLKAGEYRFDRAMTPLEVIEKIARGDVFVVHVTFPEGLRIVEMAKIFESQGLGTAISFVEATRDVQAVRDIDPADLGPAAQDPGAQDPAAQNLAVQDLEGYLFPETYAVPRRTDASKLVRLMVGQFDRVMTPELRQAAATRQLSIRAVVTLASLVEKETAKGEERPLVAAVYENRLRLGMPLQCDPTVIYALERAGRYTGNLTRESLMFDSPYNTYRHPGLPPGPIASPGRASIEAVVHPADADYLYFVSRNDGTHQFARTLVEHTRNVQRFQVQYFRQRRLHPMP